MSGARIVRPGRQDRVRLVVVGALGAVALGLLPLGGTAARAASPSPGVGEDAPASVELTSMTPAVPQPGDTLVLRGTVVNRSATDLRTVSVRLRLSPRPVVDRAELAAIAAGRVVRTGNALWNTPVVLADVVAAGDAVPYEIDVPVDDLGLPGDPGVAVLSVEALGDPVVGDGSGAEQVGLTTTLLPWVPASDETAGGTPGTDPVDEAGAVQPSAAVWLWPLTAVPNVDSDGVLLDDAIGVAVAPGGRLRTLLDLATDAPVPLELLVDPSLLEVVQQMAHGYEVRGSGGQLRTGAHAADAARWLADLQQVAAGPGIAVAALAYAQPDVVALHRAGQDLEVIRTVTDAAARASAVLGRAVPRTLPWPADGVTDSGSLDLLRASGVATVLLSSSALPPERRSAVTPDGVAPLGEDDRFVAVLSDARLARALARPVAGSAEAVALRQQVLADLTEITLEAPDDPRTVVVAPPPLWSPDPEVVRTWFTALAEGTVARAAPLDALLASPAAGEDAIERRQAPYRKRSERAELPQAYLARVAERREQLSAFRSVTSYADVARVPGIEDGLARSESALWRDDEAGARRLLEQVGESVEALTGEVRLVSRGTTTFPGETGVVPVVVANDLDVPVRVGVRLSGTPAIRFDAEPYPAFTVAPGTKASVEVPARVLGSGDITVQVQLTAPDGRAYGPPTEVLVRSTAYARAAGWLVGGLLGLLVVLLTVNFVRRRRRPRPPLAAPPLDPADGPRDDSPDPALTPGPAP